MIKAVIFDIDGVLLDSFEANLKFFQDLMKKAGYPAPNREEFSALFHLNMWDAIRTMTKLEKEEDIERIRKLGRSRAVDYSLELLQTPEGAEATLEELRQNYKLGIATGRVRSSVFEAPEFAHLKMYFDVAIAYEDTMHHKPHPEPLLLAAERLGVEPENCVYVGDAESDLAAARAARMKVIIYGGAPHGEQADAVTSSFAEIPKIVARL